MTARRRRTSRCKVARAMFWNNLRDGEVKKELCFLCLFLCCVLKPTRWQESHQRLDSDQLFFYYTSPPAKKQPHVFCWIPAVFLSHFFLAQPWHCVALRYITEVKKHQSSRGKKKKICRPQSWLRSLQTYKRNFAALFRVSEKTPGRWVERTTGGGKLVKWRNYQVNKKWNAPFKPRGAFMTLIHISKNACLLPLSDKTSESKSDYWKSSPGRCWHGN